MWIITVRLSTQLETYHVVASEADYSYAMDKVLVYARKFQLVSARWFDITNQDL